MISCDHGTITLSGTAIELTADVIAIQEGLLRSFNNKDAEHRKINERLIKNVIYSFTRSAAEKGYRTTFTDRELRDLEEAWKEVNDVETKDGKIAVKCGEATGADLICEASAAVVSVIGAAIKRCKSKERKEALAKEVFVQITGLAATIIEKEHGVSVWPDEDEDDCDDDDVDEVIAKAIPMDSDTGRKLMELLGIDPDEVKSGDDETEDDIPKFLF